jgi:hypothetical protein
MRALGWAGGMKGVAPGELARSPQRHDPLIPGSFYNLSRTVGPV